MAYILYIKKIYNMIMETILKFMMNFFLVSSILIILKEAALVAYICYSHSGKIDTSLTNQITVFAAVSYFIAYLTI